jgi:hypothetical protein
MVALLVLAGVVCFVLAGAKVTGKRFEGQWYGFALFGLAAAWAILTTFFHSIH